MARNRQRARERKERKERERLHRENVPGQLDHASAEVDEAETAIVAGAEGEPRPLTDEDAGTAARAFGGDGSAETPAAGSVTVDAPAAGRGGGRLINFLRASWSELQRVRWPDRRQVGQGTAVTLGFVIVAGAYLGLADAIATRLMDLIL